ncbi:MAG: hypothetical protein AB1429_05895 [Pseudomonadota bacterium]
MCDEACTPRQAQSFYRQLRPIRARADWEQRAGEFDPQEIGDRLADLHVRMHDSHERGGERMDDEWGDSTYEPK